MANPIIRIKRGSSAPASLSSGELAIDLTNKNLFVGQADGTPLAIGGEGTFATKSYADAAVSAANSTLTAAIAAEEAARISADSTLTSNLSAEESARIAADSTLTSAVSAEVSRATAAEGVIAGNLSTETSNRTSADSALDGKITTEKNRIDAILSAASADSDTFAEIVSLINSVDTANDSAFAGYVTSNNTALASEVSARQSADSALDDRATDLETKTQNIDLATTAGTTKLTGTLETGGIAATVGQLVLDIAASNMVQINAPELVVLGAITADAKLSVFAGGFEVTGNSTLTGDLSVTGNITDAIIDGGTY
jgi:hypothetical protein